MIRINSKEIQPGDTFICLPNAEAYIPEAQAKGAVKIQHMTRAELGLFADQHYHHPSQQLKVIGITGTNGKTTVSQLAHQALTTLGFKSHVQGTLSGALTTPESLHTHHAIKKHLDHGGTHFIMEVSSHAIAQDRIAGIQFEIQCLTNITQDHLDYHLTFENYQETKLNWMKSAKNIAIFPEEFLEITLPFTSPLLGKFNHENMQTAVAILRHLGLNDTQIGQGLSTAKAPPGRFETISLGQPFLVIVDYAHTPDGLEKILSEGQHLATKRNGKLWVVFGCGGNRDRGKRPKMAAIATTYADHTIITQDNPRHEDPEQIITDILAGIPETHPPTILLDRKKAIEWAIHGAKPNDVIVIAGKGHETIQIIGDKTLPFDDREVARQSIESLKK